MSKKSETPAEKEVIPAEKETEFTPFCGVTDGFDPRSNGECVVICKVENPEEYAKCEAHWKSKPTKEEKRNTKNTESKGKSYWGHINGTQAGKIDDCLVNAIKPMTLEDIAEFAGAKLPRCLHHLKHVESNRIAESEHILFLEDGTIYYSANEKAAKAAGKETPTEISYMFINKKKQKEAETAKKTKKKS